MRSPFYPLYLSTSSSLRFTPITHNKKPALHYAKQVFIMIFYKSQYKPFILDTLWLYRHIGKLISEILSLLIIEQQAENNPNHQQQIRLFAKMNTAEAGNGNQL